MDRYSYLKSQNAEYIDEMLERYLQDPDSVDDTWRYFFDGMELFAREEHGSGSNGNNGAGTEPVLMRATAPTPASAVPSFAGSKEAGVADLIGAYRVRGRIVADLNPLEPPPKSHPLLEPANYGLTEADLDREFAAGKIIGLPGAKLKDIIAKLRRMYCASIGIQYAHIHDPETREWLQEKMESHGGEITLDPDTRKYVLKRLTDTETFERFLHTRFVAQKRFSVEGGDTLIPALDSLIETAAGLGAHTITMGMAHRGRLNVLLNIFGKKPQYIFTEFEQAYKADLTQGEGDVKYHMGFSADMTTRQGKAVHLSLASNPSHLEFVYPVLEGITRGKQRYLKDLGGTGVVPIVLHGDASFAGQGIIYETLNLSQLPGYWVGGTVHVVVNNQVGFTTDPKDARSTHHATDIGRMLEIPIFHVNGDDPEAVWHVAKICMEYRQKFKKDVIIDLVCYRKYGHNEGDEPGFTQPLMYTKIKSHPSPREIYARQLEAAGVVPAAEAQAMVDATTEKLAAALKETREEKPRPFVSAFQSVWQKFHRPEENEFFTPVHTAVDEARLKALSAKITSFPADFNLHPKLKRFFEARNQAIVDGKGIDWGCAETLAYATLLVEGHPVRISGQDVERGTFTHRHAVTHDHETGREHAPLAEIEPNQAPFIIQNSTLSEAGVLGFEYGWSLADPNSLVIWEAQFGDFANGAQVIIDNFIVSGESKWQRASGIVLLLPHGYEGQGPEHSSARPERFLQLCGKHNYAVCNLSTPAQIFHALRRQLKRDFRKPLVIMTPKVLLRHPAAVSTLDDLSKGGFHEIFDDPLFVDDGARAKGVKRVLFCTGKIYYEIAAQREEKKIQDIAVIRLEQLYPWPGDNLKAVLARYPNATDYVFVQEEPRNMGAWSFFFNTWSGGYHDFGKTVGGKPVRYLGRDRAAAPAVGSGKIAGQEQKEIVEKALGPA